MVGSLVSVFFKNFCYVAYVLVPVTKIELKPHLILEPFGIRFQHWFWNWNWTQNPIF